MPEGFSFLQSWQSRETNWHHSFHYIADGLLVTKVLTADVRIRHRTPGSGARRGCIHSRANCYARCRTASLVVWSEEMALCRSDDSLSWSRRK